MRTVFTVVSDSTGQKSSKQCVYKKFNPSIILYARPSHSDKVKLFLLPSAASQTPAYHEVAWAHDDGLQAQQQDLR